jgi:D-alanyl-D-alanine carboxypeptidase (penicillin-binding protein 5/6)
VYITVPRQQYQNVALALELPTAMQAPVAAQQRLGRVQISLGENMLAEIPIVALTESAEGNVFRQLMDSILQWF